MSGLAGDLGQPVGAGLRGRVWIGGHKVTIAAA
jgi:hypothetical protein